MGFHLPFAGTHMRWILSFLYLLAQHQPAFIRTHAPLKLGIHKHPVETLTPCSWKWNSVGIEAQTLEISVLHSVLQGKGPLALRLSTNSILVISFLYIELRKLLLKYMVQKDWDEENNKPEFSFINDIMELWGFLGSASGIWRLIMIIE